MLLRRCVECFAIWQAIEQAELSIERISQSHENHENADLLSVDAFDLSA